ncbi:MAG: KR domain-containing protein, partial [Myxococcales bacterium]|nr:KR domain-containing protein [Myxococcales bacterium]
ADAPLAELDAERFAAVLGPKALAAWWLHRATESLPLDAFVLFSSVVATLGGPMQANYAAANALLDGLAAHRRARGLVGVSVGWGPWADVGMAARLDARHRQRFARQGLMPITPTLGMRSFAEALRADVGHLVVAPLDKERARRALRGLIPPLLTSLITPTASDSAGPSLAEQLAAVEPADRLSKLVAALRERTAKIMGAERLDVIDPRVPLRDLGLDSLMVVDLQGALSATLGRALPETLLLDHPTLESLAGYLLADVLGLAEEEPAAEPGPSEPASAETAALDEELRALEALL